jgi:hypothetical protein
MPRGSSREFREKYDGAAARLGISGATANRVDSVFFARARGALKQQGFSVDGRNVSRVFQENADLATAELGLSTFAAQTQSVNWPSQTSTDVLKNDADLAIGIANLWSIGVWWKPIVPLSASGNFLVTLGNSDNGSRSRINIYHDTVSDRIRLDIGTSAGALRLTAFNNFYTGENGNWVHVLVTWDGTTLFCEKNGSPFGSFTPPATVMDDLAAGRQFALGNLIAAGGNNLSIGGNLAQAAFWNADVRPAQAVLNASPSALNLNAASGAYTFQGNLAHWYRVGHEAAPTIGRDYAEAGITSTISLDTNSVGITDGDRQADVP